MPCGQRELGGDERFHPCTRRECQKKTAAISGMLALFNFNCHEQPLYPQSLHSPLDQLFKIFLAPTDTYIGGRETTGTHHRHHRHPRRFLGFIMATIAPNYDEAAAMAVESISSLDNLPNEVQHILNEISHLERKCQGSTSRPRSPGTNDGTSGTSSVRAQFHSPFLLGSSLSGRSTARAGPRPLKLTCRPASQLAYAEVDALSAEKIQLAERLIQLLTRTQSRLDGDVIQVRTLQGESMEEIRRSGLPLNSRLEPSISGSLSAAAQVGDSLRKVLDGVAPSDPVTPFALTPSATSLSVPPNKTSLEEPDDEDMDAEGEDEYDGEEGEEDPTPYCFCQRRSFGVMIGCDYPDCTYQWFHITCVGVKEPLPEKWYCSDCIKHKGGAEKRKGRKK
ncbi:hypothetical protein FA13DRAFT_1705410 [Coprinellus micaceus]|uniref:Chromatin modification-related protein n=1 Tax=Coprinellus micaceus TaxID=71717 RepID=A0A4Y7TTY7_COPMI|nr:hypothetical protein FA13DRAFT_1705410 [Coprinellus micaceus]